MDKVYYYQDEINGCTQAILEPLPIRLTDQIEVLKYAVKRAIRCGHPIHVWHTTNKRIAIAYPTQEIEMIGSKSIVSID